MVSEMNLDQDNHLFLSVAHLFLPSPAIFFWEGGGGGWGGG